MFHADPHPGNIMLLGDGRLGMLDFGSVGRLDAQLRSALGKMLPAIDPDVEMFGDLFTLVHRYGLSVPPEVAAVFRALATVEGTLAALSPGFDIVVESRVFADKHFSAHLTPESLRRTVTEELHSMLPMLRRLPRRAEWISGALEQGRLGLSMRLFADERDRQFIVSLLHQVMPTVLGATAGLMVALLLGADGGPQAGPGVSLSRCSATTCWSSACCSACGWW
ncbi:AarF/UbiB family protein [Saccharothrix isguenensis]